MTPEKSSVLHSGCVPSEWDAPTVVGGGHPLSCAAGVAAVGACESGGLIERSKALGGKLIGAPRGLQARLPVIGDVRGNLVLLAPPLVIEEADLMNALTLMERLLTELSWS